MIDKDYCSVSNGNPFNIKPILKQIRIAIANTRPIVHHEYIGTTQTVSRFNRGLPDVRAIIFSVSVIAGINIISTF